MKMLLLYFDSTVEYLWCRPPLITEASTKHSAVKKDSGGDLLFELLSL